MVFRVSLVRSYGTFQIYLVDSTSTPSGFWSLNQPGFLRMAGIAKYGETSRNFPFVLLSNTLPQETAEHPTELRCMAQSYGA